MITHYDEEELVGLLDGGAESDPHLAECRECRESFDEFRMLTGSLCDESVWDLRRLPEAPNPNTIANLRAFADAQRAEDEAATPLVAELLAGPREAWMPRLVADAKYRTAGVVRKLMEASDKAIDVMPPDALEISALATEIADKLAVDAYPSDTVMKLRGNAWRDRGYCLYRCSEFEPSQRALRHSDSILRSIALPEYDLARLGIASAVLDRSFERFEAATGSAHNSEATFVLYGDQSRVVSSRLAAAQAKWKKGATREALSDLLAVRGIVVDRDTQMRLLVTIAALYREMDASEESLQYFTEARFANDERDDCSDLIIQWSVALLLQRVGASDQAEKILLSIRDRFEDLGMTSESVQVGLNLAESFLDSGRHAAVELLCRRAIDFYSRAGLGGTERILIALAYLREAAQKENATRSTVREIRRYLSGQEVLFAPLHSD